jgi:FMN-dependent NADH-azoreductase
MKRLLHIIATPRAEESRTLKVAGSFLEVIGRRYPDCHIDELNVFVEKLPDLTVKRLDGKYLLLAGKDLSVDLQNAWEDIVRCIERFLSADAYLISCPMWNFSIPYRLKHYIDVILQPKYLFRYTNKGPEGLVNSRKMTIITSRGGDYSPGSPFRAYDLQEPYLKNIFGFVGITDITFINAETMDALGPQVQAEKIKLAQVLAMKAAENF